VLSVTKVIGTPFWQWLNFQAWKCSPKGEDSETKSAPHAYQDHNRIIDLGDCRSHLGTMAKNANSDIELIRTWTLSTTATFGSAVRTKGILQEIKARLPATFKKLLELDGRELTLAMPARDKTIFNSAVAVISKAIEDAETLPVIPREIQDILDIKTTERHRWLADGRLQSIGTRTVRLNGRARRITFHVFDPKVVEDLLDRGAVDQWRVEDAEAKAEKRQRAAYQAKLTRALKKSQKDKKKQTQGSDEPVTELRGWAEFDVDGFLR
jgi:hypothetical protein